MPHNLISVQGSPVALLKFQMAPRIKLWISSRSKKKECRYRCLSEVKASHSQKMWAEVSSSTPYLLLKGLFFSSIKWRCLLRVLCPVRRPITTLDCVLLKGRSLVFAPRLGSKINSWACLWVLPRPRHLSQCWLFNQRLIFLLTFCLETPQVLLRFNKILNRTISCELVSNFISLYQYSPTVCWVALLYQWRCCSGGLKGFQSHQAVRTNPHILLWSTTQFNFISTGQDSKYLSLKNCNIPS